MKIAVNTRWLIPDKLEGFGWYTFHILSRLADLMPQVQFVGIYDRRHTINLVEKLNVDYITVPPPARHPWLWKIWNDISIPFALKQLHADLYFSPDGFLPSKLSIPSLTTIHDLNFEEKDAFLKKDVQQYYKKHIRKAAQSASHVLTVSDFSRNDIISRYQIPKNKVTRIYNGPQKEFKDLRSKQVSTQQQYANGHSYFLFVGAQNPRKNLHRILSAFDGFLEKTKSDHRLVMVGEKMLWNEEIDLAWKNMIHKDQVVFTGRLSEDELNKVYSAATGLLYPSIFEGFGMPIVEAFACGTPVITSLSSAMPEVADNAALLVDPTSIDEIIVAMEQLAKDENLRSELIEKGFTRAQQFNWHTSAEETAKIIKQLLHA